MTKKFVCIQGSPEIPKGTIVELTTAGWYLIDLPEQRGFRMLETWQVEGNSCWEEVKEEMTEFTAEQIQFIAQECYNQCLVVECGEGECAEAIATRFPNLVGRIEDAKEETKEEEKFIRFKPKIGQPFYCLDESGFVDIDEWDGTLGDQRKWDIGNCFRTEQDARDELKRRESIANAWRPQDGEWCWIWSYEANGAVECVYSSSYTSDYYIGAIHPTEEACQIWGETYAKYFLPKAE